MAAGRRPGTPRSDCAPKRRRPAPPADARDVPLAAAPAGGRPRVPGRSRSGARWRGAGMRNGRRAPALPLGPAPGVAFPCLGSPAGANAETPAWPAPGHAGLSRGYSPGRHAVDAVDGGIGGAAGSHQSLGRPCRRQRQHPPGPSRGAGAEGHLAAAPHGVGRNDSPTVAGNPHPQEPIQTVMGDAVLRRHLGEGFLALVDLQSDPHLELEVVLPSRCLAHGPKALLCLSAHPRAFGSRGSSVSKFGQPYYNDRPVPARQGHEVLPRKRRPIPIRHTQKVPTRPPLQSNVPWVLPAHSRTCILM